MKVANYAQQPAIRTLNPSSAKAEQTPADGEKFEPGPPGEPTPVWKKLTNAAVVGSGTAVLAVVAGTAVLASTISGPDALGAPLIAAAVGGPVGFVSGAVAGWNNCERDNPSLLRKLGNASAWAAAGAVAGVLGTVALVDATIHGPDALGGLLLTPVGAALGAAGAGVIGWRMAQK
ncbi:hypothetical protein JST97_29120 [bacterium]|nr:hypothetical protein [bacterium]